MKISLVAAVAENGVIGDRGRMPWHLPDDLARFRRLTLDRPLVVGRRTFASIGKPLPRRRMIVISRKPGLVLAGAEVFASLELALAALASEAEVVIGGGAEIYALALPRATALHLTVVHASPEGDTFFPAWDDGTWRVVAAEPHPADARHAHAFTFLDYERVP